MTPERYQQVKQIYLAARDLAGDEQAAYLARACGGDAELRAEVEPLLADEQTATHFLRSGQLAAEVVRLGQSAGSRPEPLMPAQVGRYRLIRRIGAGGMGVVYEAEQDRTRQRVALKLVHPEKVNAETLRRFELEAQVLGRLQHPGIARIFDADTFDTGAGPQPYFAMELVEGQPLTAYAAAHELGTRQRLELIAKVADAVHHAHQKGIIHRDLKPGNILVTAEGQPKVLDFGVARATDGDIQATTQQTDLGQVIGTIPYMSPEQAAGDPNELDTRSDVYALGVIAYELLAGRWPHDFKQKLLHEAVRVILEEEPTRLSSLNRALRGDVETIVGKALEKEKPRRYQSASDLASDIRRYLSDEPISARPPSATYHLRKFASRHTGLVAGITAVFVVLTVATAVSIRFGLREAAARTELTAIKDFLESILAAPDPAQMGREARIFELMRQAESGAEKRAAGQPAITASVLRTIGKTYYGLGLYADAGRALDRARQILCDLHGEPSAEVAIVDVDRAAVLRTTSSTKEADLLLRRSIKTLEPRADTHRVALAEAWLNLGDSILGQAQQAFGDSGLLNEAERCFRTASDCLAADPARSAEHEVSILAGFASIEYWRGARAEATVKLEQAFRIADAGLGFTHPMTLTVMSNLASVYASLPAVGSETGMQRASHLWQEAIASAQSRFGAGHSNVAMMKYYYGSTLINCSLLAPAVEPLREALGIFETAMGPGSLPTAKAKDALAQALLDTEGATAEVEKLLRESLAVYRQQYPPLELQTATVANNLALVLEQRGGATQEEMVGLWRDAVAGFKAAVKPDDWRLQHAMARLEKCATTTQPATSMPATQPAEATEQLAPPATDSTRANPSSASAALSS